MKTKMIYFLTGASGVGKTTLVDNLKEKYAEDDAWVFLHFDAIWVPSGEEMIEKYGSWENWQGETTHIWIKKMLSEYNDDVNIIFEGQVNLEFIQEGFRKENFSNYKIVLIHCDSEVMRKRLVELRNQPDLFNQDMINWLNFLHKQAINLNAKIIDTSHKSKWEVVDLFEKIKH